MFCMSCSISGSENDPVLAATVKLQRTFATNLIERRKAPARNTNEMKFRKRQVIGQCKQVFGDTARLRTAFWICQTFADLADQEQ